MVLILDIIFLGFIGEEEKTNIHSYDQILKTAYPWLYGNMDLIGLRIYQDPYSTNFSYADLMNEVRIKFYTHICYFLISIYLISFITRQ